MKRSDQRSNWEATNLGGFSYKSDVFEKPIISHALNTLSNSQQRITTDLLIPSRPRTSTIGVRFNINGHSNTAHDCQHSRWPSESEHVSTARRSTSLQQYRTEHRLSSRRAVGLIRTRKNRPSNELRERALQTSPDASRQRRSTPGGINAAITDSSACNTQPTLQFNTAEAN